MFEGDEQDRTTMTPAKEAMFVLVLSSEKRNKIREDLLGASNNLNRNRYLLEGLDIVFNRIITMASLDMRTTARPMALKSIAHMVDAIQHATDDMLTDEEMGQIKSDFEFFLSIKKQHRVGMFRRIISLQKIFLSKALEKTVFAADQVDQVLANFEYLLEMEQLITYNNDAIVKASS
jgi:hypothetical protein